MWTFSAVFCFLLIPCWGQELDYQGLTCLNMIPTDAERTVLHRSPFLLKSSAIIEDNRDATYLVSIESPARRTFNGFLIQAIASDDEHPLLGGYFACQPNTRRLSCGQHINNTLTHVKKENLRKLVTTWTPPSSFEGKVFFRAYITTELSTHWMVLDAIPTPIKIGQHINREANVLSSSMLETMEESMKDCGQKRSCFGLPDGCLSKVGSCQVLVSFAPMKDGVDFQLTGQTSEKVSWLAVGLSDDKKMGDDSVTDCILQDSGKVVVQQSWNYRSPKHNDVLSNPQEGIENLKGNFKDGILTCNWRRHLKSHIHDMDFDLVNAKWHLLLARGHLKHGEKKKHHGALASNKSFNLTSIHQKYNENMDHPNFERILMGKQHVINNYRKYFALFQEKADRATKDLLTGAQTLRDVIQLGQRELRNY